MPVKCKMKPSKLISRNGKARTSAGIYLGDGKGFETEVREAHEASRANREMSINKSDPTLPQTPHCLKMQYFLRKNTGITLYTFSAILNHNDVLRAPKIDFNGRRNSVVRKESNMLWTICVILLILWLLGLLTGYTMGGVIHILLVIAIIVVVVRLIQGRRIL
jgi:hypothetical protein